MVEIDIAMTITVERAVLAIRSAIQPLLSELRVISAALQRNRAAGLVAPPRCAFDFMAELVVPLLERQGPLIVGAGVAYSPGSLVDQVSWLDWWSRRDLGRFGHVWYDLDPQSVSFYDYASREWFQAPRESGLPVAIGPYVDAGETFVNTVRLAMPVPTASGIHVLGCDLSLAHLESLFVQAIAAVDPVFALVGGGGRVLASNSARHAPGTKASDAWHSWPAFSAEDGFGTVWTIRAPDAYPGGRRRPSSHAGTCASRRSISRVAAGVSGTAERAT